MLVRELLRLGRIGRGGFWLRHLLVLLVPSGWMTPAPARTLFEQPIITRPGHKRVVLAVRVPQLAAPLRSFGEKRGGIVVEHVYDF